MFAIEKVPVNYGKCTRSSNTFLFPFSNKMWAGIHRVATVKEKVLENEKFYRSGKSQGIL